MWSHGCRGIYWHPKEETGLGLRWVWSLCVQVLSSLSRWNELCSIPSLLQLPTLPPPPPPPSSDRPHGWQPLPSYAMQTKQPEKDWILLTALVPKLPRLTWMGCPFLGSSSVSRTIMRMALYQVAMRPSSPSMEPRRVTKKASLQRKELGRKLKSWPLWLECDKCAYR